MRRWSLFTLALFLVLYAVSSHSVHAHLRAAAVLSRSAGATTGLARMYDEPIVVENVLLHAPTGPFRARIYRPRAGQPRPAILLAHGVHYLGIDEPRLVPFARNLARSGIVVLTPELAALADYRVHPSSVFELQVAARYLYSLPYVAQHGIGTIGLSFAGGLSLVAASAPSMRPIMRRVAVMGGHHDLRRVMRFLATDTLETPTGLRHMHAHDYGLVVFVYAYAERFVPPAEVGLFRDCLRLQLHVEQAQALHAARLLTPASRALFDRIVAGDKSAVASEVMAALPSLDAQSAALSPANRTAALAGLSLSILHGAADDVVPPTEAEDTARELSGVADVSLVLTPAIRHVGVERAPSFGDQLRIVHAFARVFGE